MPERPADRVNTHDVPLNAHNDANVKSTDDYGSVHAPHTKADAQRRAWKAAESRYGKVVHACPPESGAVMPCCGKTPFEVPKWHRMTLDDGEVTCGR